MFSTLTDYITILAECYMNLPVTYVAAYMYISYNNIVNSSLFH